MVLGVPIIKHSAVRHSKLTSFDYEKLNFKRILRKNLTIFEKKSKKKKKKTREVGWLVGCIVVLRPR